MSFTEDLIEGIAQALAANSAATCPVVYRSTGNYTSAEFGVYAMVVGQAHKNQGVAVRVFGGSDDPSLSDSTVQVQLDFYGTPLEVLRMEDDAFNLLHGAWGGTLGPVRVQLCMRTSSADLGQDESGGFRRTANYDLAVHRPSTNRQ